MDSDLSRRLAGAGPHDVLYVIDGSGLIFRAYHGVKRPMFSREGAPVGAVYGFLRILLAILRDHTPSHVAIAFDQSGPTFRNDIYPDYKAHRPPPPPDLPAQYALCVEATEALNIPALYWPKMEADDVIGSLAAAWPGRCVVVSVDKDMAQLVTDRVTLWDGKEAETGRTQVLERFGVPPERIIDLLALAGDASDNIPGVPGIGEKTAADFLNQYGPLEELLARAPEIKGKRGGALVTHADQARLSALLATIRTDVPLTVSEEELRYNGPDMTRTRAFLERMTFWSILHTLSEAYPSAPPPEEPTSVDLIMAEEERARAEARLAEEASAPTPQVDHKAYRCVLTATSLAEVCEEIKRAGVMSLDLETTSLHAYDALITGVALAWGPNRAAYVPVDHFYLGMPEQLTLSEALTHLRPLLTDPALPKIGHHIKYEQKVLARHQIEVRGWVGDTMLMAYLLDASREHFSLDSLTLDLLGHKNIAFGDLVSKGETFGGVRVEAATEYAAEDADVTLRLYALLRPQLEAAPALKRLYEEIELPLSEVLAEMELRGVRIDAERLRAQSAEYAERLAALQRRAHALVGGEPFNLDSPKQLSEVLFERLKLQSKKKTHTGFSTSHKDLDRLEGEHPLIELLIEYRHLSKLRGTYLEALPKLIHPATGRVHTSFKQTGTVTGRLSSADPNLQNIPLRTPDGRKIREAFIAEEGWALISADYSQVELRLLAHFAHADDMIAAFKEGADIHARTAAEMFGVSLNDVTPEQRRRAKGVNFGLMYGMGPRKLSETLKVSMSEAKEMIDRYFKRYGSVRAYFQEAIEQATLQRAATTLYGRRRPLPEFESDTRAIREQAERLAVNTPIQGTAADILKAAMVRLHGALREGGFRARMLLTVHDELVLEAPVGEVERVVALTRRCMEEGVALSVPLRVDVGVGVDWASIH
jgi:DNA polymerase-1